MMTVWAISPVLSLVSLAIAVGSLAGYAVAKLIMGGEG